MAAACCGRLPLMGRPNSTSVEVLCELGKVFRTESTRIWPHWSNFVFRLWPMFGHVWHKLDRIRRRFRPELTKVGRIQTKFGRTAPNLPEFGPNLVGSKPSLVELPQMWSNTSIRGLFRTDTAWMRQLWRDVELAQVCKPRICAGPVPMSKDIKVIIPGCPSSRTTDRPRTPPPSKHYCPGCKCRRTSKLLAKCPSPAQPTHNDTRFHTTSPSVKCQGPLLGNMAEAARCSNIARALLFAALASLQRLRNYCTAQFRQAMTSLLLPSASLAHRRAIVLPMPRASSIVSARTRRF